MFSLDERLTSNCNGTKGKDLLDETRMEQLRQYIFEFHPMGKEDTRIMWTKCKNAINEGARRLKRL